MNKTKALVKKRKKVETATFSHAAAKIRLKEGKGENYLLFSFSSELVCDREMEVRSMEWSSSSSDDDKADAESTHTLHVRNRFQTQSLTRRQPLTTRYYKKGKS